MRRAWFSVIVSGILGLGCLALGQQPDKDLASTLKFENGTIENRVYSNECLGFSLPIPDGWELNPNIGADGAAKHMSRNKLDLALLYLRRPQGSPAGGIIVLNAFDAASRAQDENAHDFVANSVRALVNSHVEHRELTREAYAVDYGGRTFFRSDYKTFEPKGVTLYLAYVFTKFRGYFLGENIESRSQEGVDQGANSLQQISFQEDRVNLECSMSTAPSAEPIGTGGDNPGGYSTGVPSGITDSAPQSQTGLPQRVRVSQQVSNGLLIRKVQPAYPDEARQAHIQGQVIMRAVIDKNGDVVDLSLISGHPLLAPAAIDAVRQWKYKPYLLNGQPVNVETQILVNFMLSGN